VEYRYLNGEIIPGDQIWISPDDRGFLFADGVYEVVRWYEGFFFDMESHLSRLKRSLEAVRIEWKEADSFPLIAEELIKKNGLKGQPAIVYLEVSRGSAPRGHAFPSPAVPPTVYAYARLLRSDPSRLMKGISVITRKDNRWSRCDIKSISLLPNILAFQEAKEAGCDECVFIRDGMVTECSHANFFLVTGDVLCTAPESEYILSGISRKNIIRLAHEAGISVKETNLYEADLDRCTEIFLSNTTSEIAPVISVNNRKVGNGVPGPVTRILRSKFDALINSLRD
jgi:D-alanine transaminase